MDDYTPFHSQDNFLKQKISTYIDQWLTSSQTSQLHTSHDPIILPHLYNTHPPLTIPTLTQSPPIPPSSGYTALTRHNQLHDGSQPWCQFNCPVFEDPHHIFIHCPCFTSLHSQSMWDLKDFLSTTLDTFLASSEYCQTITVRPLITHTPRWRAQAMGY